MIRENNATAERILQGAIAALARRGSRKLSMSDVCEQAGVARGTLYRYFKSKEDLLAAIGEYIGRGAAAMLADAIEADPSPERRVAVVLQAMVQYRRSHPEAILVLELEPDFGLEFLRGVFGPWTPIITEALEPARPHIPAVRDGRVQLSEVAHLVLRLAVSTYLLPGPEIDNVADWFAALTYQALG